MRLNKQGECRTRGPELEYSDQEPARGGEEWNTRDDLVAMKSTGSRVIIALNCGVEMNLIQYHS